MDNLQVKILFSEPEFMIMLQKDYKRKYLWCVFFLFFVCFWTPKKNKVISELNKQLCFQVKSGKR